ncbi:MAG: hypothetical protein JOZ78_09200 [Chroococcidiopsidaceae cyanobacterium CP_BM_ER_R8_30]|nr:hypothetical protein [Chroococcidiopsidaceae cyanobacterium CP_BM_ER_R8_30]
MTVKKQERASFRVLTIFLDKLSVVKKLQGKPNIMNLDSRNSVNVRHRISKVPAVTLGFWIIKIFATTLGETGGDAVSMSMKLGYLASTGIFAAIFIAAVIAQIFAKKFHPFLYWLTIIASTTVGTTLADFADRSLGIGYTGGSALLFTLLMGSLFVWYRSLGTINVSSVSSPKAEFFYWLTIAFSQTLGTALGDWTADTAGLGYLGGAVIFSGLLLAVMLAYFYTKISHTLLFWIAFVLTRPLGAVVGDFLDKPHAKGGLELSRYSASATILVLIVVCILVIPQRAARKAH